MKTFIFIVFLISINGINAQSTNNYFDVIISVNPKIKNIIEKSKNPKTKRTDLKNESNSENYIDALFYEFFENGISLGQMHGGKGFSNVHHNFNKDTITIYGKLEFSYSQGFKIIIHNGNAKIFAYLENREKTPSFSLNNNDSLNYWIEVPTFNKKLILEKSEYSSNDKSILGYIEFESDQFFACNYSYNVEFENIPRVRLERKMKAYFKSSMSPK